MSESFNQTSRLYRYMKIDIILFYMKWSAAAIVTPLKLGWIGHIIQEICFLFCSRLFLGVFLRGGVKGNIALPVRLWSKKHYELAAYWIYKHGSYWCSIELELIEMNAIVPHYTVLEINSLKCYKFCWAFNFDHSVFQWNWCCVCNQWSWRNNRTVIQITSL